MAFGPLPDWYNRFNVEPAEVPESAQPRLRQEDEPMLWCPVCSSRLISHKCKLLCQKCGYYMSCADYY